MGDVMPREILSLGHLQPGKAANPCYVHDVDCVWHKSSFLMMWPKMSLVMRKPAFCICENKDADQFRGNRKADQRLCFRYMDSTISLLPKSKI